MPLDPLLPTSSRDVRRAPLTEPGRRQDDEEGKNQKDQGECRHRPEAEGAAVVERAGVGGGARRSGRAVLVLLLEPSPLLK